MAPLTGFNASLVIWLPEGVLRGWGLRPSLLGLLGVGLAVWLGGLGTCLGFRLSEYSTWREASIGENVGFT